MHLARWPRTQRRLDSSVDAPHADTLHRRAVDFHSFSDLVVGQTRTIDPFVCLQQDARVHQGPRRSFAFRQQRLQLRPLVGHQFDSVHLHETALYRNSPTGRSCPDTSLRLPAIAVVGSNGTSSSPSSRSSDLARFAVVIAALRITVALRKASWACARCSWASSADSTQVTSSIARQTLPST